MNLQKALLNSFVLNVKLVLKIRILSDTMLTNIIGKTEKPYKANIKEVAFKVWIPALTVLIVYLVTLGNQCSASKDLVIL